MRTIRPAAILLSAAAILALAACKSNTFGGGESPEKPPAKPEASKTEAPKPAAK